MAKFYFNLRRADGRITEDPIGDDIATLDEARDAALLAAKRLADDPDGPKILFILIIDEAGRVLATVPVEQTKPKANGHPD